MAIGIMVGTICIINWGAFLCWIEAVKAIIQASLAVTSPITHAIVEEVETVNALFDCRAVLVWPRAIAALEAIVAASIRITFRIALAVVVFLVASVLPTVFLHVWD